MSEIDELPVALFGFQRRSLGHDRGPSGVVVSHACATVARSAPAGLRGIRADEQRYDAASRRLTKGECNGAANVADVGAVQSGSALREWSCGAQGLRGSSSEEHHPRARARACRGVAQALEMTESQR